MLESAVLVAAMVCAVGLFRLAAGRQTMGADLPLVALLGLAAVLLNTILASGEMPVAIVGGMLAAAAALYGLWFNAHVARQAAEQARAERKADTRRAIRAEIDNEIQNHVGRNWDEVIGLARQAFVDDPDFRPMVIPRKRDLYMSTVVDRIELLDDRQVETVVRYYTLVADIELLKAQMLQGDYEKMKAGRRERMLLELIRLEERLVVVGYAALEELAEPAERPNTREATQVARAAFERRYPSSDSDDQSTADGRMGPDQSAPAQQA